MMRERLNSERGDSLLSLIVVCAIVGIVSVIAVPSFILQKKTSMDSTTRAEVSSVKSAMNTVMINYPHSTSIKYTVKDNISYVYVDVNNDNVMQNNEPGVPADNNPNVKIALERNDSGLWTIYGWSDKGYHYVSQSEASAFSISENKFLEGKHQSSVAGL